MTWYKHLKHDSKLKKMLESSEKYNGEFYFTFICEPDTTFTYNEKINTVHVIRCEESVFIGDAYSEEEAIQLAVNSL